MHVYIIDYYSAIKNEMPFAATCLDTEMSIPSEKSERGISCITYMWNLKYDTNLQKTDSQRMHLWLPRGKGLGRDKLGVWY